MNNATDRRPLKIRERAWPLAVARLLLRAGLTPNAVSVLSVVFAAVAGVCLWRWPQQPLALLLAAGGIQLRLLCNLLDGLMAVEGGASSASGELFNELPDRLADCAVLVGAGYGAAASDLGWSTAWLAVLTAYIRAFGGGLGCGQDYRGPMAKQQRMFVMTVASVAAAAALGLGQAADSATLIFTSAFWIIIVGALVTCGRRVSRIYSCLKEQANEKRNLSAR